MNIEVIAVGSEVLAGYIVNTNTAFLSRELSKSGFSVNRQSVLPDDPSPLKSGLKHAIDNNTLVIATGGLGPTLDDVTAAAAADIFQSDITYIPALAEELKQRYGSQIDDITAVNQSTVPSKAIILHNPIGSARGLIFQSSQCTLILLPGVPQEMYRMWADHALPYIKKHFKPLKNQHTAQLHFFNLTEPEVDPFLRQLQKQYPLVRFGIYVSPGILLVNLEAENIQSLAAPFQKLSGQFSRHLYDSPSGTIEEAVHSRMIERGLTLCTAESCTGGSVASRLTRLPGASKYFLGAAVVYSNALKTALLGVPASLIESHGAVSEPVVRAMAQSALEITQSDYALAVSGIAGPDGGTALKPIGTVWCALAKRYSPVHTWTFRAFGNRETVIEYSVNILLGQLLTELQSP